MPDFGGRKDSYLGCVNCVANSTRPVTQHDSQHEQRTMQGRQVAWQFRHVRSTWVLRRVLAPNLSVLLLHTLGGGSTDGSVLRSLLPSQIWIESLVSGLYHQPHWELSQQMGPLPLFVSQILKHNNVTCGTASSVTACETGILHQRASSSP